jgi:hypothetical protein
MTGRPKIKLDLAVVKKLCSLHCTGEEIASVLDVSYDTLERRIKELGYNSFSEFFIRFSAEGKISIRRKQYELAMQGNVHMLKQLGTSWLGQSDKQQIDMVTKDVTRPVIKFVVNFDKPPANADLSADKIDKTLDEL